MVRGWWTINHFIKRGNVPLGKMFGANKSHEFPQNLPFMELIEFPY
jgi:hypothetical protein